MKKFYVGVKAFIKDERGVLLVHSKKGYWDIPGGRIDDAETFEAALDREISEEIIGAKLLEVGKLLSASRMPFDVDENTGLLLIFFEALAFVPDDVVLCDEMDGFLWVTDEASIPKTDIKSEISSILKSIVK